MNQYITVVNRRTLIALIISFVTLFLAYRYNINYNIDLTLISIAIVFPLVFTIRSSFRRREKALEHLSQFRAAIKTVDYFFMSAPTLTEEKKQEISDILIEISEKQPNTVYKDDAGIKELQYKKGKPNSIEILEKYYAK